MDANYQTIHEKIRVAGVYQSGRFDPKKFEWRTRVYPVQQVTLVADVSDQGVKKFQYSVVSGANVYRLVFNWPAQQWWLEEVWVDG